jgi:uncharacterized membrane protein YeaQ/YmgE (transglycosylase-associated protein family)
METIINLIIQLIAGVVGGNAAGAALKDYNLGNLGNTIAGAIGGVDGPRGRGYCDRRGSADPVGFDGPDMDEAR